MLKLVEKIADVAELEPPGIRGDAHGGVRQESARRVGRAISRFYDEA